MVDYRLTKQALKQLKKLNKSDKNTAIRIKSVIFLLIEKTDFLNI
jgi:mRNA-degrading endonuclease YafQ of YafQ-DinJ toxin-antitoxin module